MTGKSSTALWTISTASNRRFTRNPQPVHRANGHDVRGLHQDEHMPVRVGSIISPQWLAAQMGLPVEEVQERLERAWKEDQWPATMPVSM